MARFRGLTAAAMGCAMAAASPALAQVDEAQLCVNRCMFHHGPASSPACEPFVARNGILYTAADAGSPLAGALMSGRGVEVVSGGRSGTFPLGGSRAAIADAARACGIRP